MNDNEIRIMAKKLEIIAKLEIDGIKDLIKNVSKICGGKSLTTTVYTFFLIIGENLSSADEQIKKESIEFLPSILRNILISTFETGDEDGQ